MKSQTISTPAEDSTMPKANLAPPSLLFQTKSMLSPFLLEKANR